MSALYKGKLVLWKDDKGFGFVRPETGEKDFFIHISALKKGMSRRPEVGDTVHFQPAIETDAVTRRRIAHAVIEGIEYDSAETATGQTWFEDLLLKILVALPILLSSYLLWKTTNPIPLVSYLFMSALTILYYAADKHSALRDRWRVPEIYLHCFEVLGGWPGALLAQKEFRHKHKKTAYLRVFWGIVTLHGLCWLVFLYFDFFHP